MVPANTLMLIGGTMAFLLGVAGFVLSQRDAWRTIVVLVTLLTGMNIGVLIWSELLYGWDSFRLFVFWLTAFLPPLIGLGFGTMLGYLVNLRISNIRPRGRK